MHPHEQDLAALLERQDGMVARRQLRPLGIGWDAVDSRVAAGRWAIRTPRVISAFTGDLTTTQRQWLAVLHAGPRSMLAGLSAAGHHGLAGWVRDEIAVMVQGELSLERVEGVRFVRSRRPLELLVSPRPGIPAMRLEPAVLLWAAYDAELRPGIGALGATVQQRLTTAARLLEWVELLRPLRRAKPIVAALNDIAGGAHSVAELDVARMCRRFGMPLPDRQTPRQERSGRQRWTDCEWVLPDGSTLVLEVDGSFHLEVVAWGDDIRRSRALTSRERTVVRCTAYELRHEPLAVATDLVALGLPGQLPSTAA